jgi:hypothetical protein
MFEFFSGLESLVGVEAVNSGRFIPRSKINGFEANIQFYDECRRTFRVRVACEKFISYPTITVSSDARDKVEDYIKNYRVDGSASQNSQRALPNVSQEACYGLNQTAMVVL